jgi:hypothetical protein
MSLTMQAELAVAMNRAAASNYAPAVYDLPQGPYLSPASPLISQVSQTQASPGTPYSQQSPVNLQYNQAPSYMVAPVPALSNQNVQTAAAGLPNQNVQATAEAKKKGAKVPRPKKPLPPDLAAMRYEHRKRFTFGDEINALKNKDPGPKQGEKCQAESNYWKEYTDLSSQYLTMKDEGRSERLIRNVAKRLRTLEGKIDISVEDSVVEEEE